MSASAIKAGEAFIKIWANDAEARTALKTLRAKVKSFADEVSGMGAGIAAAGAAIAAPFTLSARTFAGFADTMSTVKAVTNATAGEFAALNATAKHLGETTSFTAQQAAEGMLALGRAGYTVQENIAALPKTLALARAGALELGEATTIMADTSRSFGIAADQSERVADALVKASNISNTDVQLIGESMKHVATSANMTGQSLESVSAALAVMANRGVKGEMAGTALRKVLLELANAKTQAALKKDFGIDTKDAQGNMRAIMDIMREFDAATRGMGSADKLAVFHDLFDTRGLTGAGVLTENIAEWERFNDAILNAAGTSKAASDEMDNNLGGSFRLMMSAIEGVQIAIGEATEGTLREWMASIESAARSVSAFVSANQEFIVGVMKIGAVLLGAGTAIFAFGKGAAIIGGVIGAIGKFGGGLQAIQDRLTGVAAAQKAKAAADKALEAAENELTIAIKKQESAQKAQENAYAQSEAAASRAATAKQKLAQAERDHAAAVADAARKRAAVDQAQSTVTATTRHADATRGMAVLMGQSNSNVVAADKAAEQAKKALTKATNDLAAAERAAASASQAVVNARRDVEKADLAASASATRLAQANNQLAQSQERATQASGTLNSAIYRVREAMGQAPAAASRASTFIAQIGSPKVAAAAGSIAMLAGSVSMLAGDSEVGKAAQCVANIAGIGAAASMSISGVRALGVALRELSASTGALAAAGKAAAVVMPAIGGWLSGRWIKDTLSGFNGDQIAGAAKRFADDAVTQADGDLLQAQRTIQSRILELREMESQMGTEIGGGIRIADWGISSDSKKVYAEIDALEAQLKDIETRWRAVQKEEKKAEKAVAVETNVQAVKDLASAWDEVFGKMEAVNKRRADREGERQFNDDVETDPFSTSDAVLERFEQAKAAENELVERLHELEAARQKLLSGDEEADAGALTQLQSDIKSTLNEYEKAVSETDVWERFFERADDAVTKTRESIKRLAEDSKNLDLDYARKQDDQRFNSLLKSDWVSAAAEVAQAMARVNADWLATGRQVAELRARAEAGDADAYRELEEALARRNELVSERSDLEGRQREVDSGMRDGSRGMDGIRDLLNDEAKRGMREDWDRSAAANPHAANAALAGFIADLENELSRIGALAERANAARDYAGVSAYEEQAQAIKDQLAELRGMRAQTDERSFAVGSFSAQNIKAMTRDSGYVIGMRQLDVQRSMDNRLAKLIELYEPPTVIAVN